MNKGFGLIKVLIGIVIIAGIAYGGFYYSDTASTVINDEKAENVKDIVGKDNDIQAQTNKISASEITEKSVVTGMFSGYYEKIEKEAWGVVETCNTIVILEGHLDLTKYFMDMVNRGNTVNSISSDGYLRINLPWSEIPESIRMQIINSTPEQLVELTLTKKAQHGGGASACYSFFSFN
jgi:hypothetical protein